MLMAAHIVLGLLSLGGGDSGAFSTQLCTGQRGSCKNLGYLLGFIAGTLSGRDQGVKGLLTSSGEGICSSVCAVSFSVSSGISLRLALHAVWQKCQESKLSPGASDLMFMAHVPLSLAHGQFNYELVFFFFFLN